MCSWLQCYNSIRSERLEGWEASRRTPVVGGGADRERDSRLKLQVVMMKTMTVIGVEHPQKERSLSPYFFVNATRLHLLM